MRYKATHVWSYDFLADRTEDARQLKLLLVIDEFTRECLALELGRAFRASDVMLTLQYIFAVRGTPKIASVLDDEGVVQAQSLTQLVPILQGGVLAHHVVDRIADVVEKRKGYQTDGQHHGYRLQKPPDDKGNHCASLW